MLEIPYPLQKPRSQGSTPWLASLIKSLSFVIGEARCYSELVEPIEARFSKSFHLLGIFPASSIVTSFVTVKRTSKICRGVRTPILTLTYFYHWTCSLLTHSFFQFICQSGGTHHFQNFQLLLGFFLLTFQKINVPQIVVRCSIIVI